MIPSWLSKAILKYVLASVLGVSTLMGAYLLGRSHNEEANNLKDQREFIDTTNRIDNAPTSTTRDNALDRLRASGHVR